MWESLEEDSLEGLISKHQGDETVMSDSRLDANMSFGTYIIIGFSAFFFLFKLGNRASIKFDFIEADDDDPRNVPESVLNQIHKRNSKDQQVQATQDGSRKKQQQLKVELAAMRDDNEYENSIVTITQKKRKHDRPGM